MQLRDVWVKKWEFDYINDLNLSNIEWLNLDVQQLISFYIENYLDKRIWQYVSDSSVGSVIQSPIGMSYLSFDNNSDECNFLLGVVKNNCDKKTIVCAMVYLDNYYVYKDYICRVLRRLELYIHFDIFLLIQYYNFWI